MKPDLAKLMLSLLALSPLLAAQDALAELSTRDRCEQTLRMMGVSSGSREDRGWSSLCEGVIRNDTITRYGNWYGPGYWGGGEDPKKAGHAAPVDSLDEVAQRHDYGYQVAENYGKIFGKQYELKLKAMADKVAVEEAMSLPEDPRQWPRPPADPEAAVRYHDRMITGFILESDIYKNLSTATKVGDVITSPFITLFDETDYSHIPDLDKLKREVKSYINGWKKDVDKAKAEDGKSKDGDKPATPEGEKKPDTAGGDGKDADKPTPPEGEQKPDATAKDKDKPTEPEGEKKPDDAQQDKTGQQGDEAAPPEGEQQAGQDQASQDAKDARQRLKDKIKQSKEEQPEPEPTKKSYADMTPEERHEALKNNDPEAWDAFTKGLKGETADTDKEDDSADKGDDQQDNAATGESGTLPEGVTPVQLSASASFDEDYSYAEFKNIVTTTVTITFWNVGSLMPDHGAATAKIRSVASLNGVSEEHSCSGTFSGGPNGVFHFGGCGNQAMSLGSGLHLSGGSTVSVQGKTLTVSDPSAFAAWNK
jgi:hypothetical protein